MSNSSAEYISARLDAIVERYRLPATAIGLALLALGAINGTATLVLTQMSSISLVVTLWLASLGTLLAVAVFAIAMGVRALAMLTRKPSVQSKVVELLKLWASAFLTVTSVLSFLHFYDGGYADFLSWPMGWMFHTVVFGVALHAMIFIALLPRARRVAKKLDDLDWDETTWQAVLIAALGALTLGLFLT